MNKKRKTSANGVKKKLMGAVCMLLVASIMMISATYAWFTLSTAPEITGITTSVGANGSLEMALLNGTTGGTGENDTYADMSKIKSAVGDSMAVDGNVKRANITWGNLVDLSDNSYGLQNIKLMPARWNNKNTDGINADNGNYLLTPKYGADGRVADVSGTTMGGGWDGNSWSADGGRGVRAVASTDALSAQAAGLMSAKNEYNSYLNQATAGIKTTLTTNMQGLTDAIIHLAQNKPLESSDKDAISNLITGTQTALGNIDKAYKAALKAYAASVIRDENQYTALVSAIAGDSVTAEGALAKIAEKNAAVNSSAIATAIHELGTQKGKVVTIPESQTDANYKDALNALVNTDSEDVTIAGFKKSEIYNESGKINSGFISNAMLGIDVVMGNDTGVFAYIGTVAGDYKAAVYHDKNKEDSGIKVSYGEGQETLSIWVTGSVETKTTADTSVRVALNGLNAAENENGSNKLADVYGYALEMAFRTNAANSYLQLSKDGIQRVYKDGNSVDTMGAGSTMTFKAADNSELTLDQITNLMKAIRVTFVPGNGGTPKTAVLDVDKVTPNADGSVKAGMVLCNHTFDGKGAFNGTALTDDSSTTGKDESIDLMQMTQNTAQKMTVVVWLDGDKVDNSMVANALESITGSLNLQFKSSAELQPMANTALKDMASNYTTATNDAAEFTYNGQTYTAKKPGTIYNSSTNRFLYYSTDGGMTVTRITDQNIDEVGRLKPNPGP